jgi:hypothetical protein
VFHDEVEAHRDPLSLHPRHGAEGSPVKLQYVGTDEQVADVMPKPLSRVKFETLSRQAWYSPKGPSLEKGSRC